MKGALVNLKMPMTLISVIQPRMLQIWKQVMQPTPHWPIINIGNLLKGHMLQALQTRPIQNCYILHSIYLKQGIKSGSLGFLSLSQPMSLLQSLEYQMVLETCMSLTSLLWRPSYTDFYSSRIQYAQAKLLGYLQLVSLISLTSKDRNFINGLNQGG